MKILFVTDFYHPYSGGVEIHVRTVANELAQRGHDVAVATLPAEGRPRQAADGPVQVFTVGHTAQAIGARFRHQDRPWAPPFPDPVTMAGLRRVVRSFGPDVIHGHDWLARSAQPRLVSGSVPVLTSFHYYTRSCAKKTLWRDGTICDGPELRVCLSCAGAHYGKARGAVVTLGLRAGSRLEDRRSASLISVSAATEAGNRLTGHHRSRVIPNPVAGLQRDDDHRADTADQPDDPVLAMLPAGPFILFVGDIRPEKGVAVLTEAIARLQTEHGVNTPLVVVGERMSDRLHLPDGTVEVGPVSHPTVQRLWRLATVGVIPSLWPEPFGLVAVEAMAAGCPLVASKVGGLAEILADGRAALVPPGDPEALAGTLADVLTDSHRRDELTRAAAADVDRYSVSAVVDQIEDRYRSATGRR